MLYLLVFIFLALNGCKSTLYINVDSLSQSDNVLKKYNKCYITTKNKEIDKNSLIFKEFYSYIEHGIKENNIDIINNHKLANCLIYVDYGISAPNEKIYVNNIPHHGIKKYSHFNTYESIDNNENFNNLITYNPNYKLDIYNSDYTINSYSQSISHTKEYDIYLFLDARKKDNNEQLWNVKIKSTGSSGDLREIFPYLMFIAKKKIAKSTPNKESYKIYENDDLINQYKFTINN